MCKNLCGIYKSANFYGLRTGYMNKKWKMNAFDGKLFYKININYSMEWKEKVIIKQIKALRKQYTKIQDTPMHIPNKKLIKLYLLKS